MLRGGMVLQLFMNQNNAVINIQVSSAFREAAVTACCLTAVAGGC